jgi:hypothetical protein
MPARNGLIPYPELEPLVKRNAANELGRADDLRRGQKHSVASAWNKQRVSRVSTNGRWRRNARSAPFSNGCCISERRKWGMRDFASPNTPGQAFEDYGARLSSGHPPRLRFLDREAAPGG